MGLDPTELAAGLAAWADREAEQGALSDGEHAAVRLSTSASAQPETAGQRRNRVLEADRALWVRCAGVHEHARSSWRTFLRVLR
jgi:hypothetical protein